MCARHVEGLAESQGREPTSMGIVLGDGSERTFCYADYARYFHRLYEALIQANVPDPAARRVAESVEKDMTTNLQLVKQDLQGVRQELQHVEQQMTTRFDALDAGYASMTLRVDLPPPA